MGSFYTLCGGTGSQRSALLFHPRFVGLDQTFGPKLLQKD